MDGSGERGSRIGSARRAEDAELLEAATEAAEVAAEIHREEAGKLDPGEWSEKGTADFVTEVDREAERRILATLRARFPHHQIVAEEGTQEEGADGGSERGDASAPNGRDAFRWIVDPLDGTTNFLHGYPEFAVSVAGIDDRGLRVAVVLNSATGERFDALRGRGARRNGEPIRTSGLSAWRLALVGTGFPFKREELLPAYLGMFSRVLRSTSGVRRGGSAALDLCDLACGRLDAFWELWLMPWDIAAGALIVREAGGSFGPLELPAGAAPPRDAATPDGAATLEAAVAAARRFAAAWDGAPWEPDPAGGAYFGANATLLEELRRTLSGPLPG